MSFNTSPGRAEYTASAAQTIFTFPFKIYNTSDMKVYLTPAGQTADDAADILIETTDYTVTINGDNGGDVTLTTGATLNDSITLVRELPVGRDTEYQQNGDLTAEALNDDQDYQTYLILDGALANDRALTVHDSIQGFDTTLPNPGADKMFIYSSDGKSINLIDPSSTSFFKDAFIVDSMQALLGVDENTYGSVNVRGYHAVNDGGGGLFNWDSTIDKSTANAGTIIDPSISLANQGTGVGLGCWVRQYDGAINVKWFGANETRLDNEVPFANAISASENISVTAGSYSFLSTLEIPIFTKIVFSGEVKLITDASFNGDFLFKLLGKHISLTSLGLTYFLNSGVVDRVSAIGNIVGDFSSLQLTGYFRIQDFDYGIRLDQNCTIFISARFDNIYFASIKYAGIYITEQTVGTTGQSALQFGKIVGAEQESVSVSALNIQQVDDVTATTDSLQWDNSYHEQTGWTVMRRLVADSGDASAWKFVDVLSLTESTYTATKIAATYYDYVVVVSRYGVYLAGIKTVNFDVLQYEESTSVIVLNKCKAVNINSLYYEWRNEFGNSPTTPPSRGPVIDITTSELNINSIWADEAGATAHTKNSTLNLKTGDVSGDNYLIEESNNIDTRAINLDGISSDGSVPAIVDRFNHPNSIIRESTDASHKVELNHGVKTEIATQYKGTTKASITSDIDDGIVKGTKLDIALANKSMNPICKNDSVRTILPDGVTTNIITMLSESSLGYLISFDYLMIARDSSFVGRVVEAGKIQVQGVGLGGLPVTSVTKFNNVQNTGGQAASIVFTMTDDGTGNLVVKASATQTDTAGDIFLYVIPTTSFNVSNVVLA